MAHPTYHGALAVEDAQHAAENEHNVHRNQVGSNASPEVIAVERDGHAGGAGLGVVAVRTRETELSGVDGPEEEVHEELHVAPQQRSHKRRARAQHLGHLVVVFGPIHQRLEARGGVLREGLLVPRGVLARLRHHRRHRRQLHRLANRARDQPGLELRGDEKGGHIGPREANHEKLVAHLRHHGMLPQTPNVLEATGDLLLVLLEIGEPQHVAGGEHDGVGLHERAVRQLNLLSVEGLNACHQAHVVLHHRVEHVEGFDAVRVHRGAVRLLVGLSGDLEQRLVVRVVQETIHEGFPDDRVRSLSRAHVNRAAIHRVRGHALELTGEVRPRVLPHRHVHLLAHLGGKIGQVAARLPRPNQQQLLTLELLLHVVEH
mmetsp:Transcript_10512/g.24438  ORF Transcript_10512/g.24438 Transcript_10512/m.24438 type:complete len:374 (+) Transcript_10512:630-1751(+)